jgi:hypothetical protein
MADGFVQSLEAAMGSGTSTIAHGPRETAEGPVRDDRAVARSLAAALDRAVELGEWELAERIASQALRIAREHPHLAERLARLRAASHQFDAALAIIDSCSDRPASMRLLRAVCLLHMGRRYEAHLDLHDWGTRASAPLQARLLLALLEWDAGDEDAAIAALGRNVRQIEDPGSLAALFLMANARGRAYVAHTWATRLQRAIPGHEVAAFFETLLSAAGIAAQAQPATTAAAAGTLSNELLGQEHLIPALVEATHLAGDHAIARLLIDALTRGYEDLQDPLQAATALARLHECMGEREAATAWGARCDDLTAPDDVLGSIGWDGVAGSAWPREQAA